MSQPPRTAHHQNHLSDRGREALYLADELRGRVAYWMTRRGVISSPLISPYVNQDGQPEVVIRMNAYLARAMLLSFDEHFAQPSPPPPTPPRGPEPLPGHR